MRYKEYKHMSRRLTIFAVFAAIVLGGYGASRLLLSSQGIPVAFQDARLRGALIAQNIVNLSNESRTNIEKISALDKEGKFSEAFAITGAAMEKSIEIRNQAAALADEISSMTKALPAIQSFEARQAAIESITNRFALLNKLINYSNYLSELLTALQDRFEGTPGAAKRVAVLVNQINAEVQAINTFNGQAGQAMDRFDAITKGK
jgi:DNA repair ATPase RecN